MKYLYSPLQRGLGGFSAVFHYIASIQNPLYPLYKGVKASRFDDAKQSIFRLSRVPVSVFISCIALALLLYVYPLPAFAEDIGVLAAVDKTDASLEDSIALTITVSGTQNSPPPQLPDLPGFRVQSMGTSSSVQIVNMSMKSSVTFNYRLTPLRKGSFTINPATVTAGGKTYATQPITIQIREPAEPSREADLPVFAELSVSNDRPYVNEQIVLTFKLFRRIDVRNLNLNISYDNFRKEDLGKDRQYRQTIDGIEYQAHEFSAALFPNHAGKIEIPPAIVDLDAVYQENRRIPGGDPFSMLFNDPFFGGRVQTEHKTVRTRSIAIEVLPLPEEGKPAAFSNLVGKFDITAALGKSEVDFGDSSTLTVTISGTGNVKDIPAPAPELADKFKVYPDQPQFKQDIADGKISGEKTFKFALVPLAEGKNRVPSIPLTYFDPERKQYISLATQPLTVTARPSQNPEKLNAVESGSPGPPRQASGIKILGKDIFPIHAGLDDFEDQKWTARRTALYAGGFLAPAVLFLAAYLYHGHRLRLRYDPAFYRSRGAYKLARKRLEQISAARAAVPKEFVRELSKILREYVGDKLNLHGTACTPREVEARLKERNFPDEQALSACRLLERCESFQYASGPGNGDLPGDLLKESLQLIDQLEKQP
ncbi:MAG: protein BatD [Nitrospinae bacterium]|nr:protein BatD [Nitrospinota bacterium]